MNVHRKCYQPLRPQRLAAHHIPERSIAMSSLSKVLKAFHKDTQYLPVPYPAIPELNFNIDKPSVSDIRKYREEFETYEKKCAATKVEIDARFAMALERIKLCAVLHGAMNMFGHIPLSKMKHFKWCPHEEWMDHIRPKNRIAKNEYLSW